MAPLAKVRPNLGESLSGIPPPNLWATNFLIQAAFSKDGQMPGAAKGW